MTEKINTLLLERVLAMGLVNEEELEIGRLNKKFVCNLLRRRGYEIIIEEQDETIKIKLCKSVAEMEMIKC